MQKFLPAKVFKKDKSFAFILNTHFSLFYNQIRGKGLIHNNVKSFANNFAGIFSNYKPPFLLPESFRRLQSSTLIFSHSNNTPLNNKNYFC